MPPLHNNITLGRIYMWEKNCSNKNDNKMKENHFLVLKMASHNSNKMLASFYRQSTEKC